MSLLGKWRIVDMPDYTEDYPDRVEPAYILFGQNLGPTRPTGRRLAQAPLPRSIGTTRCPGSSSTSIDASRKPRTTRRGRLCFGTFSVPWRRRRLRQQMI
ncbi:MAG: hypothetical protein FJX54_17595 [Alphaproteobacteria bacterium]|nr:hypothetical protein [Alphaproteobacteria bacterium]